jgi:RNA polymerase sigma factor (sigma-70 family)
MAMSEWVAQAFEENRTRLRSIAQRMLGSATEADDAVQEVWLRLSRAGPENIDNLGGWLTTVVSRVCLDMLRARGRHEEPVEAERYDTIAQVDFGTPESDAMLADSIGPALVIVLDSLEPRERLAFVLHDLFAVPFSEVAPIVGRSPAATRQMVSRARRRLQGDPGSGPTSTRRGDPRQAELVDAFLAASRQGNFEALLAVLDPDVVLRSDTVAVRSAAARQSRGAPPLADEIRGRDAVARVFAGRAAAAQAALVNGVPAAVWAPGGRPRAAFIMRWSRGKIVEIEIVADPRRVRTLDVVL